MADKRRRWLQEKQVYFEATIILSTDMDEQRQILSVTIIAIIRLG